jgi:von Willebrand factor type A domain
LRFAGNQGWRKSNGGRGRMRAIRIAGGGVAAVLAALLAAVPAQAAQAGPGAVAGPGRPAASGTGQAGVAVLDVAVLVDESGSETPQKVEDEKQTVGTIVQTMLNPASRVTVIGFGGVNNVVPNQNPVDVVCQPTIASGTANLDYLSNCVGQLHRRTEQQGDDTDYAAALSEAMNYLGPGSTATPPSPPNAIKVVLMMTDGAVDVHRDLKQYGVNWQLGEQTAINQQLATATSAGVQVWPLGFGTDIGTGVTQPQALQYLNNMAAHGAPAVCDTKHVTNQPHATWVNNPSDAISALDELYTDAACLGHNGSSGPASHGLTVNIPAIASSAAISVDRVNPAISVTFTRPDGTPWTDSSAISGADSSSPVEVLHISDITKADVGTWHIKLTAPPSLASQLVSATVFWQGAVRAIITATPNVNPGQPIDVKLTVLGPNGPITDPSTLKSLLVGVTASGQGLPSPVQVKVSPLSGPTGVGTYAGTYTAPSQRTTLTITGTAAGYGLYATQIPATVTVGTPSTFLATPHLSGATSVPAGGSVSGSVDFTNTTGSTRHVLLKLTASGATAAISPGSAISVPSGSPPSVPFTVTIAKSTPAGTAGLEVQAVDADTGQVYNTDTTEITVTQPPGFLAQYKWEIIGLLALILLAVLAALAIWKIRRNRRDVRGLVATLRRGGVPAGRDLEADEAWAEVFPFIIREENSASPRLDHPPKGSSGGIYQVRRAGRGLVRLTTPMALRPYEVEVNGPGQDLGNGLELAFRDTRNPNWTGSGRLNPAVTPDPQVTQASSVTAADWSGSGNWSGAADWSGSGNWSGSNGAASPTMPSTPTPAQASPPPSGQDQGSTPTIPTTPTTPPPKDPDPWL